MTKEQVMLPNHPTSILPTQSYTLFLLMSICGHTNSSYDVHLNSMCQDLFALMTNVCPILLKAGSTFTCVT